MAGETALSSPRAASAPRRRGAFRPARHLLRRLVGLRTPDILSATTECWIVAEGTPVEVRPAHFLPGQLDRIAGTEFGTPAEVVRDFRGGFESRQAPTMAYRLADVLLADGVLYAADAVRHLRARQSRWPGLATVDEIDRAVLYESWTGNRWFGNWLCDDCLTYRLAEDVGTPITTRPPTGHAPAYERALGMTPRRTGDAWFEDLILFDDRAHNDNRRRRADDLRCRLAGDAPPPHPGVYLLRGTTGAARVLRKERAIAERLASRRGFRVIDPTATPLDEIVAACAGARIVAGVEGSQLMHGLMLMPRGAGLFVIQPPDRTVSVLKMITDRQGQDFGFVVGRGKNEAFSADIDEIERSLDLF